MLGVKKSKISLLIIVFLEHVVKKKVFVFFRFRKCYNFAEEGLGSLALELIVKHSDFKFSK